MADNREVVAPSPRVPAAEQGTDCFITLGKEKKMIQHASSRFLQRFRSMENVDYVGNASSVAGDDRAVIGYQIEFDEYCRQYSREASCGAWRKGIISAKLACRGSELLQLQGFDMDVYDELEITEHQRADLAGNSFAWPCITAAVLALISALRWNTASEDEELDELASMQSRLSNVSGGAHWEAAS
ncbi:hypothetical protein AK812_SmicGene14494 [Symbiodinium microadriaticum]|uniref:Uncharacterized protein n=1 Tax=Symbiodinium microadriaticum TaxID=2951 RepID=A0A1Q9E5F4_SYMMI|nr:hypothetical protein AK812_SmicGene14494 [Symbiodinium microadriaticum]